MSNHTGVVGACQPSRPTASAKTSPPSVDSRLVARYGAAALAAGYAAIPHVVMKHRRGLGVTAAEWDYICELWSYWRSAALPAPNVEALARGLGVDQSTIRRYRAGLEGKGLLRVVPDGPHNRYDLRPLINAAVGLDRLQGHPTDPDASTRAAGAPSEPGPRDSPPDDRAESHAHKEVENKFDSDSIPPYPPLRKNARLRVDPTCLNPDDHAMVTVISALSSELGDDTPVSSMTRAGNLWDAAGVPRDEFLVLIDEAAARTRGRQDRIIARGRDGGPSGMRYFFAVLTDLLHPVPQTPVIAPDRWGIDRAGRHRRRRSDTSDQPPNQVAWAESPVTSEETSAAAGPPPTAAERTWRAALVELRTELTPENYARWFAPTRVVADTDDDAAAVLRIAVPDTFHHQWLDRRLRGVIERILARIGAQMSVEFVVGVAA